MPDLPEETPIEIWFQDEARIGQKNGLVRQWARRGTRPRQPADQRYENAYLFGAICPAHGKGAALALPFANTEAMQLYIDEIAANVAPGAHAVLIFDRAGWHTTPELTMPANMTPIWLPSRAPELNPVETSGNTCARIGSQTPSSRPTTPSSTPPATHGINSPQNLTSFDPSDCERGHMSVKRNDRWYKPSHRGISAPPAPQLTLTSR